MKRKFIVLGIFGIIATILTGGTAFSNVTEDFIAPFIVLGILISILIIEIGYIYEFIEEKKNEKK